MTDLRLEDVLSDDWGKETINTALQIYSGNSAAAMDRNDDALTVNNNNVESSEFALSQFLDEIIDLPIKPIKSSKSTTKIPLGDITNTHQQQKTNSLLTKSKEKTFAVPAIRPAKPKAILNTQHAPLHTLTSTQQIARMDSLDDGIWSDIDDDMLTLMENSSIPINQNHAPVINNHNIPTHIQQQGQQNDRIAATAKDDIDKQFNSRFHEGFSSNFTPSFSTARGKQVDMPSTQARLKAKSIIESADRDYKNEPESKLIHSSSSPSDASSSSNSSPAQKPNTFDAITPVIPPANFMTTGFSTAKGKQWAPVSAEKLKEAELKFKAYNDTFVPDGVELPSIELSRQNHGRENVKRHKSSDSFILNEDSSEDIELPNFDEEEPPSLEPEKQKSSFATASGSFINAPSKNGLENSHALFKEADDNNMKRLANGDLKYETVKQLGGFTMGFSGKKFDISSQVRRDVISKFEQSELSLLEKEKKVPTGLPSFSTASSSKSAATTTPFQSPIRTAPFQSSSRTDSIQSPSRTPASPFRSPSPLNTALPGNETKTSLLPPKRTNSNRLGQLRVANKPFKSPVRSKEKTRAAADRSSSKKATSICVFDLTVHMDRKPLSSLGKPLQYTKQQLVAKNIPIAIINMTASNAKYYRFDGSWGYKEAQQDMLKAGALPHRTSLAWVENHYSWILWKKACLVRSWPDLLATEWTFKTVLDQLLYRYEREINMGHRPVLKKVLEADDISVKHMVLVIADIVELKSGGYDKQYNTSSKYQLHLSDGWYGVCARIDTRMEKAIKQKKLKIGSKLSICGAQILGEKEGISPLANDGKTMLSISANGCLPARWDQKLGYHPQKYLMRSIPTIFDDGGTVTALDIVVCRKFPILFSETLSNGAVIIRTHKEEQEARQKGFDGHSAVMNFKIPQQHSTKLQRKQVTSEITPKDRKVSGYFKMLICDTKSNPDQRWAYLTLSNANEMNHMDIVEGNRYKVFFVVPQQHKNKQQQARLYLKTTFMTRWEPAPPVNPHINNAYIPRYLSNCHQIPRDRSMYFDLVVLVLQTSEATRETIHGRVLYHQTILVTDQTQGICQIDLHLPSNGLHAGQQQQVLGFVNLKFVLYDEKFGITHLKATDETEVLYRMQSPPEYIQKGVKMLREWKQQNPAEVEAVTNRIRDIVQ